MDTMKFKINFTPFNLSQNHTENVAVKHYLVRSARLRFRWFGFFPCAVDGFNVIVPSEDEIVPCLQKHRLIIFFLCPSVIARHLFMS